MAAGYKRSSAANLASACGRPINEVARIWIGGIPSEVDEAAPFACAKLEGGAEGRGKSCWEVFGAVLAVEEDVGIVGRRCSEEAVDAGVGRCGC